MIKLLRRLLDRLRAEVPTYDVAPPVRDPQFLHVARKYDGCPDARQVDWLRLHDLRGRNDNRGPEPKRRSF